MSRLIIDIGASANDGTGDNLRDAFNKVNQNFQTLFGVIGDDTSFSFTNLSDAPPSYTANQIFYTNSSASISARTLIPGSGIDIDTSVAGQLTISTSTTSDLTNHINTNDYVIGKSMQPDNPDATAAVAGWNLTYSSSPDLTVDDLLISKLYADTHYYIQDDPVILRPTPIGGRLTNEAISKEDAVLLSGSLMTGLLSLSGDTPTAPNHAISKGYLDSELAAISSDTIIEGTVNKFFSDSLAQDAISVDNTGTGFGELSYAAGVINYAKVTTNDIRTAFAAGPGINITDGTISVSELITPIVLQARGAISVSNIETGLGTLSYNSASGIITYSGIRNDQVRSLISVEKIPGTFGNLVYSVATGKITLSGVTSNEIRSQFTAGSGINIASGVISNTYDGFTNQKARDAISTFNTAGERLGAVAYDNSLGIITYTGPLKSEITNLFTTGPGITSTDIGSGRVRLSTVQDISLTSDVTFSTVNATTSITSPTFIGNLDGIATVATTVASLAGKTTDNLAEGSINKYYTSSRVKEDVNVHLQAGDGIGIIENAGKLMIYRTETYSNLTTTDVPEPTLLINTSNLYFTSERAREVISVVDATNNDDHATSISYNESTGVITSYGLTRTTFKELYNSANVPLEVDRVRGFFLNSFSGRFEYTFTATNEFFKLTFDPAAPTGYYTLTSNILVISETHDNSNQIWLPNHTGYTEFTCILYIVNSGTNLITIKNAAGAPITMPNGTASPETNTIVQPRAPNHVVQMLFDGSSWITLTQYTAY